MIPPKIAQLPPAPVRADAPVDFSTKADAMVGALQPFANQANDLADFVNVRADNASTSAATVAGVQSAVSADRVLSQQAASNAAGSAAAALNSANTANSSATAAQQAANASEASAVRAEDAAQYVENIADGAAPINNPNFTGVVRVNSVPLGYAALAPTEGDGVAVLREGAGGWLGQGESSAAPLSYPTSIADTTNLTKAIRSEFLDNGVEAYASGIHFSNSDTWGRLRVAHQGSRAWIQGGYATNGTGWTVALYHTANMLNIGTTAATARTALNLFADTSGVMTNGSGQLSSDMSDFLSSTTFDEMSSKVGGGGEIDFITIADNATDLTPQPGKSYWLTRTGTTALTTEFACTHAPGKIRTWHVIVSKGTGANDTFIPSFRVSGLTETSVRWSGGGTIKPTISGVSHVMIMFMQIDQNVRATIVDGW